MGKTFTLGDRMKEYYENRTRIFLPRRTYTIIRVDGKAFHTYTQGLERPFDQKLIDVMNETAQYMCDNIQGAKLAYVQSDEISILITDFDKLTTSAWFDGNIQKIVSVAAGLAVAKFNALRPGKIAIFDARTFTIPSFSEVKNYFVWRQQDATRNSISSAAQALYSHKELEHKSTKNMQEMIFKKGINWNDYSAGEKRGRIVLKETYSLPEAEDVIRHRWVTKGADVFTKNDDVFEFIPKLD